jgi:hypothetical protein
MPTDLYVRLSYDEYKELEEALKNFASLEKTHTSGEKDEMFYHNSFRIPLGSLTLEVHGPLVRP